MMGANMAQDPPGGVVLAISCGAPIADRKPGPWDDMGSAGDERPGADDAGLVASSEAVASSLSEEQSIRVSVEVRSFRPQKVAEELGIDLQGSPNADYGGETPATPANTVRSI